MARRPQPRQRPYSFLGILFCVMIPIYVGLAFYLLSLVGG